MKDQYTAGYSARAAESYPFEMQINVLNADGHNIPIAVVIVHAHNFNDAKDLVTSALQVEAAERMIPTIHIDPNTKL